MVTRRWALLSIPGLLGAIAVATAGAPNLRRVRLSQLDVTNGPLEEIGGNKLRVSVDRLRAVLKDREPGQRIAELRFTYLGPTAGRPLQSGELRRQIGLKLLARDACNLLYVMWRIEPEPKLVVSVKSNFVGTTSAECGGDGYLTIRPRRARDVGAPAVGTPHVLRAELRGSELRVYVDGALAWEGPLGHYIEGLAGPAGLRSDNGRFELQLYADEP